MGRRQPQESWRTLPAGGTAGQRPSVVQHSRKVRLERGRQRGCEMSRWGGWVIGQVAQPPGRTARLPPHPPTPELHKSLPPGPTIPLLALQARVCVQTTTVDRTADKTFPQRVSEAPFTTTRGQEHPKHPAAREPTANRDAFTQEAATRQQRGMDPGTQRNEPHGPSTELKKPDTKATAWKVARCDTQKQGTLISDGRGRKCGCPWRGAGWKGA